MYYGVLVHRPALDRDTSQCCRVLRRGYLAILNYGMGTPWLGGAHLALISRIQIIGDERCGS